MMDIIKNDKGKSIKGPRKLLRPEYGTGKIGLNGEPEVNWKMLSDYQDGEGFDTRIKKNGNYKNVIILPKGTVVIRYGNPNGRFTAPQGTKYEELALPYEQDTVEYHEYRVIADGVTVYCNVEEGIVAPGFGSNGGAIQYKHEINIKKSMEIKILEEVI